MVNEGYWIKKGEQIWSTTTAMVAYEQKAVWFDCVRWMLE